MSTAVIGAPEFRARSGRTVRHGEDGTVTFHLGNGYLSPETAMDAEEFFQAQRDVELGRWRWPENPEYVVYPFENGEGLTSLSERTGVSTTYLTREAAISDESSYLAPAAHAYLEAHPERKPWHDAKPGEVWVITTSNVGDERAVQVTPDRTFQYNDAIQFPKAFPLTYDAIESARRIWPEDAS